MTNAGAGFVKGERHGNQIYAEGSNQGGSTGVAELSSHEDIQARDLDPDRDVVIEELEGGNAKIREREEGERVIKVKAETLGSDRLEKFFTEEELSSLREKDRIAKGEGDTPEDIDDVWDGIKEDVKEHNKEVAKRRKQKEIERAKEELKKGTKYDREVSNLSGEEFKSLIAEANEEGNSEPKSEELEAAIQHIEDKYAPMLDEDSSEINPVEADELSEGLDAFREYSENEGSDAWSDIADDVEKSSEVPDTEVTTLSDGSTYIETSYDKLKDELGEMDHRSDKDTEIVDKEGEVITAKVPEGESYE
ncbi:hypothetical protein [Halorubrum persicum]|uniref:hypothetical protein n=1 Tax=Halorubrum persicum TaxID=1383844 RepID=UPI00118184EB|nr:hypothetical protein [Halorubrum persicum]